MDINFTYIDFEHCGDNKLPDFYWGNMIKVENGNVTKEQSFTFFTDLYSEPFVKVIEEIGDSLYFQNIATSQLKGSLVEKFLKRHFKHFFIKNAFCCTYLFDVANIELTEMETVNILFKSRNSAKKIIEIANKWNPPSFDKMIDALYTTTSSKRIGIEKEKTQNELDNIYHPFFKKTIVFTGTLKVANRAEATKLVREIGGIVTNTISRSTNYLVRGYQDEYKHKGYETSNKEDLATALNNIGANIEIIEEDEFWQLLGY